MLTMNKKCGLENNGGRRTISRSPNERSETLIEVQHELKLNHQRNRNEGHLELSASLIFHLFQNVNIKRDLIGDSRDSSVGIAMGYGMDGWGSIPGMGKGFSLLHSVQTSYEGHPTSIQWVPGAISPGVKWPGCETDHSSAYSFDVKNDGTTCISPLLHTSSCYSA
jgi:hypothetical protein